MPCVIGNIRNEVLGHLEYQLEFRRYETHTRLNMFTALARYSEMSRVYDLMNSAKAISLRYCHFTINTGHEEYITTEEATLPSTILVRPDVPRVPTTVRSIPRSSA